MSIVKKADISTAETLFKTGTFGPNTVKCLRRVDFELSEIKRLIAAIDAYNNGQTALNQVKQVRCRVIAETPPGGGNPILNMYMVGIAPTTGIPRDFNIDTVAGADVVLGKPCPPHCTTADGVNEDHFLAR